MGRSSKLMQITLELSEFRKVGKVGLVNFVTLTASVEVMLRRCAANWILLLVIVGI